MALASKPIRVEDLANHLGRQGAGDRDFLISGVAALETAGAGDLSFVRSPNRVDAAARSRAGALIVPEGVDPGGHLKVGEGAFVGTRTGLHRDVPAGSRVGGSP